MFGTAMLFTYSSVDEDYLKNIIHAKYEIEVS